MNGEVSSDGEAEPLAGSAEADDQARETLLLMIAGHWVAQAVRAACELRIPNLLADGPATSEELARKAGADRDALHRLLQALTAFGVVAPAAGGRFQRTALSDHLRRDVPGALGPYARFIIGEESYRAWGLFLESVRTGETAFQRVFGMPLFGYLTENGEVGRIFNEAMRAFSVGVVDEILEAYDFSGIGTLVDVGGGQGQLLAGALRRHPQMRGVLFDLPAPIEQAAAFLEAEGVAARCRLMTGDFFGAVPEGGDAYLLKSIIHDWDDDRAATILSNCRKATRSGGRLLLVERVIPQPVEVTFPHQWATLMDLNMLVLLGGRERTIEEFAALMKSAGFVLGGVFPTPSGFHVLEGIPT